MYKTLLNNKLHGQVKNISFYWQICIIVSARFGLSLTQFMQCTRQYFEPSLYILFAADFNYLIRCVIVTSTLLSIRVVNSHATSAYECELLAFKWHYLRSVRREMLDRWFDRVTGGYSLPTRWILFNSRTRPGAFFTSSKLIDAFVLAMLKQ